MDTTLPRRADPLLYRIARALGPLNRPMAGRRFFPLWAVVHHRGRRSGREFAIPVAMRVTSDGFFIALPFGERTQWARNVLAAGGCTVRWRARDYAVADPQIVGFEDARHAFNPMQRWILRTAGVQRFIRLRPASASATSQP